MSKDESGSKEVKGMVASSSEWRGKRDEDFEGVERVGRNKEGNRIIDYSRAGRFN